MNTTANCFKIGNTNYSSLEEYRQAIYDRISTKASAISVINPLALFGFEIGKPLNFDSYEKLGFNHPKTHSYYNILFNANGEPSGDPVMVEIFKSIYNSQKIDDPILIYPYQNENGIYIIVLDGGTRSSSIAFAMALNPDLFQQIPIKVFNGTKDEAIAEMVRRNMSERSRCLTDVEMMRAVYRFIKMGWTKEEISERLGQDPVKWRPTLDNYINAGTSLIPSLVKAWEDGVINRSAAFQAARLHIEKQEAVAEQISSGKKIKGSEIQKETVRELRLRPTLTTLAKKLSPISEGKESSEIAVYLESKGLLSKYNGTLTEINNLITKFRNDVLKDLS